MSRVLHLADLRRRYACNRDSAIFAGEFGDAIAVTEANVAKYALTFDWHFAGAKLLTESQRRVFKRRMLLAFRDLNRGRDPDQRRRRQAMAYAFFLAFNSPME